MKSRCTWIGFSIYMLFCVACDGARPDVVTTSSNAIQVTRVTRDSAGQPVLTRTTVNRATIDHMTAARQAARASAANLRLPKGEFVATRDGLSTTPDRRTLGETADIAEVSAALTQCSVLGQPAGSSCPAPCSADDLWIYDQPDLVGNNMLCLESSNADIPQIEIWRLNEIRYNDIDAGYWDDSARSAWGGSVDWEVHCYSSPPTKEVNTVPIPTFQQVNDLDCVFPNSRSDNGRALFVCAPGVCL